MKEVRGISLGQASQRQPVNLPDISGNKLNMQSGFKKKELQISTSVNKNVIPLKPIEGQIQLQTPSVGGRSYYDANAKKLPQITQSPRHRESSSNDYISLGARIQDQMKQYNTSSQSQNIRHIKTQSVQPSISRGGGGGGRAMSRDQNIMTPTHYQLELLANTHSGKTPQSTTFENYLKKVIKSVERRKKKGHLNASQKLGPLVEIEASSKYGFPNANNTTTFQNFSNQVLSNSLSLQSQNVLMHKQNQQLSQKNTSQVVIEEEQSKDDTTNIDNDEKISFTKSLTGKGQAQISLLMNNETTVMHQDPKATEQVAFLLREAHKKNQIFIPLEQHNDANSQFMYKEMKNAPNNHAGVVVFSKQGFVTVGKERHATSDFISNDQFIQNGVTNLILKDIPFFKKFQITRLFKQWKYTMRWNVYSRKREQLARSWVFSKPIFSEKYDQVTQQLNSIRTLPLIEIKQNVIYGKKQQQTLEDRCIKTLDKAKTELNEIIQFLKDLLQKLKKEIVDDDYQYDQAVKENKVLAMIKSQKYGDELVMFSKARRLKELEEEQLRIQRIRHQMFDKLIEYIVSICKQNLIEALFENKREFKATFTNAKNGPQFEILICFNEQGSLDTDPPLSDHHNSFLVIFENVEKSIYQNHNLMEFINELNQLFFKERILSYKSIFKDIKTILWSNSEYKLNNAVIFDTLNKDLVRCREYLEQFTSLQSIYDFTKEWNNNKKDKISLEMGFYKETWLQMDSFNLMIEEVPSSNTKLGTIMVETITLKKYLQELPKSVIDSIRHNVTLTMETETKSLREELSKTSEILDQLPTSLNVYVEQVNTLKYVKEKQEDFKQKFQTINKLHQLCKQDNIKVSLNLQMAIEEVSHLYENLPKLQKTAAEGLSQNKDTMERIMQSSSLVLSKKIKAFEKKYVETYLQDRSRLEDCADTLEELFKRSSKTLFQLYLVEAIHEIRSKVILYKEFLKLLYEDEPNAKEKLENNKLQCGDDYEFVADLHKQTIKLWKMLLYWKKRRQMCYNSPFLQLDTSKVIRSINKVSKYFEEKLTEHEFIRDKGRPLSKVVIHQVKETSLIIDFLKDLRKESLQQRHWLQIFNLIKAPHLKNSVTFTIINLREYHIQNYREEIQQIIEHANTELKYEKIFKSIKEEWEQLELKIIPYRETMDSYILINTDILTSAIEENLTTLETIGHSQFAQHVKEDILDWIKILKTMLKNVEIWVEAQKYWINLDSIFPLPQLQELFQQNYQEFMDLRSHFKRIMWSAYKNPKATYNLNIGSRIEIFNKLIGYFAQLQKKVNEYLEQKRLAFPRFFFLTDAQFLKFLTLANSNQDFNAYINQLFQGAQKLYINKIYKAKVNANEVSQREKLIQSQLRDGFKLMESSKQEQILPQKNKNQSTLSVDQHEIESEGGKFSIPYLNHASSKQQLKKKHYTNSSDEESSQSPGASEYDGDSISQTKHRDGSTISQDHDQKKKEVTESQFEILGMIGLNKELFLFEKQIVMEHENAAEKWLVQVEAQMQETIARMINYAVSSFPKQSLDEWILDYPQQIIMTTIHLILSHEVNELLDEQKGPPLNKQTADDQEEHNSDEEQETPYKSKTSTVSAGTPSKGSKLSTRKYNSKQGEDEEDQAMIEYMKKKNELKAQQQAKEEEEKKKKQDRLKAKAKLNEIPEDPEKEKRKFIDAMFGKDFPVYASILQIQAATTTVQKSEQPSKGDTDAKAEYKDTVMTMLQNKSFKGLYLRLQFWVNQIIKALYGKKYQSQTSPDALEINLHLHGIQKMSMKSIIVFLQFHRDIVDSLMQHNVNDSKDFEWQSQIRLQWTGVEPGCKVECGGWSTYQQNEYLGSTPRLVLTPLTNRYFVFISSAMREKSAVILKCGPSHQFANDIFEEFSNMCTVPYKRYQCNAYAQMKLLMQYINGAALASVWIFFEHMDKLPYIIFQTFNKEVQMVQQQFIIAELSGGTGTENKQKSMSGEKKDQDKRSSVGGVGVVQRDMHIKENKTNYIDHLESQSKRQIVSQLQSMRESQTTFKDANKADQSQQMKTPSKQSQSNNEPFTKIGKACFGVFGSISHAFILNHSVHSDQFLQHSQSAFRSLALTRPNEELVLKMVLKAEGFDNYEMLSTLMALFLKSFYEIKEALQSQDKKKSNQAPREQVNDQINISDLKAAIKLANILKEQELLAYYSKVKYNDMKNQPRDIQVFQKTRDEKIEEIQQMELKEKAQGEEREKIEINSIKEGLKLVFKQKFFNQWRDIQLSSNSQQQEVIDQYQVSSSLEQSILQALERAYSQHQEQVTLKQKQLEMSQQLDEIDKEEVVEAPVKSQGAQLGLVRKGTISAIDIQKRFQASSGLASLEHSSERQVEEKKFLDLITVKMREAIQEMKLDKVNAQLRNCINVIEYLRRVKGIALVGPVCTGKTQILKIVSKVLSLAFGITMRTSVVNSAIFSHKELYGATEAFQKQNPQSQDQGSFGQQSVFEIILDVFDKERGKLDQKEAELLMQSIFFDSVSIDSSMAESLLSFMRQANYRESENNCEQEFLVSLSDKGKLREGQVDWIPVTFPNCNILMFPSDLCLFFEAESLRNSSPSFVQQVGLILTEADDLEWTHIYNRHIQLLYSRHHAFFSSALLSSLPIKQHLAECFKEFMEPFLEKLQKHPKIASWSFWNIKSSIIQFFSLLNSAFYRLTEVVKEKDEEGELAGGESMEFPIKECIRDVVWSSYLMCVVWAFGAGLSKDLRKVFEEQYAHFRRKFNIALGGVVNAAGSGLSQTGGGGITSRNKFTLFDIYFDPEKLQWDLLQEKLEYKLKLHYDPLHNTLLIPTVEISQAYFMADYLFSSIKHEDGEGGSGQGSLNKHLRIVGPSATSKSVILNTFAKRSSDQFQTLNIPMSAYLTFDKMKGAIEAFYTPRRRNLYEPKDKDKKIVLIIDDLHLQSNLKINVLEFLRTWCISKGYYDVKRGFFKNIADFGTLMAENSDYRRPQYCRVPGREPLQSQNNRFLFYSNMLYQDEFDQERFKVFIQHWLTSKMWNTSKIVNKYYILITNCLMTLSEKLKRSDVYHYSSFLRLQSFHLFARFCANLANYTLISDDTEEGAGSGKKGREEDAAADMMAYELQRTIADRILMPQHRVTFIAKIVDACKIEFLCGNHMTTAYLDGLLLGNYHDRRAGAHIKYLNYNKEQKELRDQIREKLKKVSNNHFLESFLDAPNGLKEVFRLSRILFKEMQHVLICGMPGTGKHEYLQLAALLNDALMFEINATKYGEPLQFARAFKDSVLSAIALNAFSFIVINDQQLRDPTYIDYVYNFIVNICNKEHCVLMDHDFRQALIDKEGETYLKGNANRQLPSADILLVQAIRKIQKNVHIVLLVGEFQTYFQWVSLFPGLESKCEVIYMEELSNEGYAQLSQNFFQARDIDNGLLVEAKLSKCLVDTARQAIRNRVLTVFYTGQMLAHSVNEDFLNCQMGEYIMARVEQVHGHMYANGGGFQVRDSLNRQTNYSLPVEMTMTQKARYIMFIELFRFFYDFLSLNLVIRRNYYDTFLRKNREFTDFFKDIKSTKTTLHSESNAINCKLVQLKDKIGKSQQLVADKEGTILRRRKDIKDLEVELRNNKEELSQIIKEKDSLMDEILEHLEKTNGSEFSSVITLKSKGHWAKESERDLMNVISVIIEKDPRKDHSNTDLDMYFLNREELINILDSCRHFEYDPACFQKLKTFITQYTGNDFKEKSLYRHLFAYLMELYRKLNVRNTMANTYAKIQEIKDQIQSHTFSINYSTQFIDDKKEEMEGQKAKYEKTRGHEHNLSKRIEEAEISHMRTDHIFINIEKHADQINAKLIAIQQRLDALLGDCIIMAASVCYLGVFAIQDRVSLRKELAENIKNTWRLKCSPIWFEAKHSKAFKQVLKEYGLRKVLLSHNHSRVLSEAILLETLFTMVFAPSCPLVVDPTGQMQEYIAQTMAIKSIYASDANINTKIEQTLRSSHFAILNDLNDCSKDNYGLSSQDPILQRLASSLNNGFDFDYEKLTQLKDLHTLGSFFNSFSGVNKRIPANMPEYENLSFYQVQVMTPRLEFTLSKDYMSKLTMVVAMDSDQGICQDAWVEVKECLVKHFLPEVHTKWQHVRHKIRQLNERKAELHKVFENAFLVANQDTLQNISEYSLLKQSVEDIKYAQEEKASYMKSLIAMMQDHALLTNYANVILVMFLASKTLSKVTGEITYSWRMFLNILDQILHKTVIDLNTGISKQQEFTIDEDFFSSVILPALHSTLISGIKQHLVPLYNLIFSLKMSLKKRQITEAESDYFLKQLLTLKDFQKWRETDHEFVDLDSKIEKTRYFLLKRELIRIYPDVGRKIMDQIEKELGQNFVFKTASLLLFGKLLNGLTLMQKINIGLLCPDHEFKSKLCQLVYEQLSSIFAFNEEYIKLHHFIKTASWSYPIALFSQSYINIINTVCSIASYYGVGLEVLRTEMPQTGGSTGYVERQINGELNQTIKDALTNYNQTNGCSSDYERLFKEAVTYGGNDIGENTNRNMQQINYEQSRLKDNLQLGDKMAQSQQIEQNPLKLLEACALNGSWVFISTMKFPQFWHKMCLLLNNLRAQGKIANSFRVFTDLQGFTQNEIPDSFLFDNAVSFHLTEQNNEDMEGFNDIWANILNDKILTDLTTFKVKRQDSENKIGDEGGSGEEISHLSQINIDNSIKNDKQRDLYKEFMRNQKEEESKNISNTLIFGSEGTGSGTGTPGGRGNATGTRNGQFQKLSTIELVQKQQSISSHQTNQRQMEDEEAKISRINSINQSVDISKGENTFIKELQGQFGGEGEDQNRLMIGGEGIKDQKSVVQTQQESSTINIFEMQKHYEQKSEKKEEVD